MRTVPEKVMPPSDGLLDLTTIMAHAMPVAPKICGLYFLICRGESVYVGQSVDAMLRVCYHATGSTEDKFDSFAVVQAAAEDLDRLEMAYIAAFAPRYNIKGVPKEKRRPHSREYGLAWGKESGKRALHQPPPETVENWQRRITALDAGRADAAAGKPLDDGRFESASERDAYSKGYAVERAIDRAHVARFGEAAPQDGAELAALLKAKPT